MQTNKHTKCKMHCSGIKNSKPYWDCNIPKFNIYIYIQMNRTLGGKFRTKRNRAYLHAIMNSSARISQRFISSFLMHHTWCSLSVSIIVFIIFFCAHFIQFAVAWCMYMGLLFDFVNIYLHISIYFDECLCLNVWQILRRIPA